MTAEERRLRNLLTRAQRYLRHDPGCKAGRSWPATGDCSCGAREVHERIQLEKLELRTPGRPPHLTWPV